MINNKLIIAAAGSGKTTYLVQEALNHSDESVLVTTYTLSNEASIRQKILAHNNCIPKNITIQTWFSFLLQHGVRPYQGSLNDILFDENIRGMLLVNQQSGVKYKNRKGTPVYFSENKEFERHYFTKDRKIYSDKISKFIVKCNQKSDNAVIDRVSRIYDCIFIDEVQDLAGYDLDIIKLLFKSTSTILLVGDPRQVTYLTHISRKYDKYKNGKIKDFVENELGSGMKCAVDESTLRSSHRNNQPICDLSSRLYPDLPAATPCSCCNNKTTEHNGVLWVKQADIDIYCHKYDVVQLRWNAKTEVNATKPVMNIGVLAASLQSRISRREIAQAGQPREAAML